MTSDSLSIDISPMTGTYLSFCFSLSPLGFAGRAVQGRVNSLSVVETALSELEHLVDQTGEISMGCIRR